MPPPDRPPDRRPHTGGRVAGQSYAPEAPAVAGKGRKFPWRDYTDVTPATLRQAYEDWQDICYDVREQRNALGLEQKDVAARAGIALNTVQNIERGEWVMPYNLLLVCTTLGLRLEQAVPVRKRR